MSDIPLRLTEYDMPCAAPHPKLPELQCVYPVNHGTHFDGSIHLWLSGDTQALADANAEAFDQSELMSALSAERDSLKAEMESRLTCEEMESERDRLAMELYHFTTQLGELHARLEEKLFGGWRSTDDAFDYLIQLHDQQRRILASGGAS